MKLFTTRQIAEIDKFTIENEPVADIDFMERASRQITNWLTNRFPIEQKLVIFAGPGNNGGDALAVARQMAEQNYRCAVILPDFERETSDSQAINLARLMNQGRVKITVLKSDDKLPVFFGNEIIVDGLFGSGLTRPLSEFGARVVTHINSLSNMVISIDIPSGLMGEDNSNNNSKNIIRADYTLTLQFPKISFFFPENEKYTGTWTVLPIGLHPEGIEKSATPFYFSDFDQIKKLIPARKKFAHKGDFGHAFLAAGSFGKMGAAVLASIACLRSGAGLITTHIPGKGYTVLQTAIPEAMVSIDRNEDVISEIPDLSGFSAAGIGPGLGKSPETTAALKKLIEICSVPLVLDADALNILAENKDWCKNLPLNSILTPHPGEFKRLAGETENSFARLTRQIAFSKKYGIIVVLKGAYTTITFPDGRVFFNSTGNPGMATAGSGDVLTGIILGLLSQGISPGNAALMGVYIHGMAGDLAATEISETSLIAGDIINYLGKAFLGINP